MLNDRRRSSRPPPNPIDPLGPMSAEPEEPVHVSTDLPRYRGPERFDTGPRIGEGGMGEVVLQLDRNIGRELVKKMLHREIDREVSIQRFLREARVQGQLEHPGVVPVHDFGVDGDGRLFFSMKRIRGQTLAEILAGLSSKTPGIVARFSRHRILSAFVQVCLTVSYAHKRGVVHRDLKPSNIMLGDFGEVYVLDWGLAKIQGRPDERAPEESSVDVSPPLSPEMTSDGDLLGTPLYMAPEQLRGEHAVLDGRADVFALGVILFEILTLERYRRGHTLSQMIVESELAERAERPSQRAQDVPPELDDLCVSALARDPAQRLGSARALADGVERYLAGDRDLAARRAQAAELLSAARARLAGPAAKRATETVAATREVLRALALAPDDEAAQQLLVKLVVESSRELSPEALRAYGEREAESRVHGMRRGIIAYVLWLCALPAAFIVGIRDARLLAALVATTVACMIVSALGARSRWAPRSRAFPLLLSAMTALAVGIGTSYLGPFVLTPLAACASLTMFLMHATKEEAPGILGVWLFAMLAAFAVEWLHWVPPAYTFEGGQITLHARMLSLPEAPTLAFLVYSNLSFIGGLGYFVAQLRGKQQQAERQLFGQAWLLQQLFPPAER